MDIRMSASNVLRMTASESEILSQSPPKTRRDSYRNDYFDFGLSFKFENSMTFGADRGVDPMDRQTQYDRHNGHTFHFPKPKEDNQWSSALNPRNEWNSSDKWFSNNPFNPFNGWKDWMSTITTPPEQNPMPGMRAIRKHSDPDIVYSSPPIREPIREISESERAGKDWYNTYVDQTQRFAQFNGNTGKPSKEKRVHFQDDISTSGYGSSAEECTSLDSSNTSSASNTPMNGFCSQNQWNGSAIRDEDREWRSKSRDETFYSFPKPKPNASLFDSLYSETLIPMANNFQKETKYLTQQSLQNMSNIGNSLNNSGIFDDTIWGNPTNPNNSIYRILSDVADEGKSNLQKLMTSVRKVIPKTVTPNYTWSGQLPRRVRTKTPVFSCKIFLGGIPYDLTDSDLHCTFAQFGHIQIQWPGRGEIRSAIEGAAANKAGYVYIIFETYENVAALLSSCTMSYRDMESGCRWYYSISSRRQKSKEVQVIPFDIGDRFFMKSSFSGQMDHSRTVFVGGLHGMLAADGLAKVMDDLFGGVIFAGLDTDKHKYPLGSGRVTFDNQDSYQKAVLASFVEIKSARFKKKIQIDPYIEGESQCVVCRSQVQNPIYCREEELYFCGQCWDSQHSDPDSANHRPIVKNKSSKP